MRTTCKYTYYCETCNEKFNRADEALCCEDRHKLPDVDTTTPPDYTWLADFKFIISSLYRGEIVFHYDIEESEFRKFNLIANRGSPIVSTASEPLMSGIYG